MGQIKKKKAVSGFIQPRWAKERIVRWLEIGAIPAVVGLWFPDWAGGVFRRGCLLHSAAVALSAALSRIHRCFDTAQGVL